MSEHGDGEGSTVGGQHNPDSWDPREQPSWGYESRGNYNSHNIRSTVKAIRQRRIKRPIHIPVEWAAP